MINARRIMERLMSIEFRVEASRHRSPVQLCVRHPLRGSDGQGGYPLLATIDVSPEPVLTYCRPRYRQSIERAIALAQT